MMEEKKEQRSGNSGKLVVLLLLLVLVIGGTYAWLTLTLRGTKTARIEAGKLAVEVSDPTGVSIENAVPITDAQGMAQTGNAVYSFIVENTGTINSEYSVYLDRQELSDATNVFAMNLANIKCQVIKTEYTVVGTRDSLTDIINNTTANLDDTKGGTTTSQPVLLSSITASETTASALDSSLATVNSALTTGGRLAPNHYFVYQVRLWIDENTEVANILQETTDPGTGAVTSRKSAEYSGKIRVEATQTDIETDTAYNG